MKMKDPVWSNLSVTPPNRYDITDDEQSDGASDDDHMHPSLSGTNPTSAALFTATKHFIEIFHNCKDDHITIHLIQKRIGLPLKDVHALVAILEVLEVIVPRGSSFLWRGMSHIGMLLRSNKFKVGVSMECGVAMPKVAAALIPHLVAKENVAVTAADFAAIVWDAQHDRTSLFSEAEVQQRRALSEHIHDVLLVMMALGIVSSGPPQCGAASYVFDPSAAPDVISPKGLQQSARMRNMRVLFDGPAPSGTVKTVADHANATRAWPNRSLAVAQAASPLCAQSAVDMPLSAREHVVVHKSGQQAGKLAGSASLKSLTNATSVLRHDNGRRTSHQPIIKRKPVSAPAPSPKVDLRNLQAVDMVRGIFESRVPFDKPVKSTIVQSLVQRYEGR